VAKRSNLDMRAWALIGAEQRLVQLAEEAAAIHRVFPELRRTGRGRGRPAAADTTEQPAGAGGGRTRRRRRRMSADARRRISEAQKARWARQRAGGNKKK
jgi:hypothetical protein